ncbi:hypothetical protein MHYP_G00260500 [Metynnis hypsauchen]
MHHFTLVLKHLLLLSVDVHLKSSVSHSLQYFYTTVTPGINFPEFTVVGLMDGKQIMYYDSNIRKMIPKTEWMEKNAGEVYWSRQTQLAQGTQENFKVGVNVLMQRFNHTEGVHTLQLMYGCEFDDDGTKSGHNQYGYDGEDFIILDLNTSTYIAAHPKAVLSKHKWERRGEAKFQKDYLQNECIESLKTYVGYSRASLERKVFPEVSLFQKDSSSQVHSSLEEKMVLQMKERVLRDHFLIGIPVAVLFIALGFFGGALIWKKIKKSW